ncbi:MAG: beta galactosidase jelly roll domain-containing protein [Gemmatales bacterium]
MLLQKNPKERVSYTRRDGADFDLVLSNFGQTTMPGGTIQAKHHYPEFREDVPRNTSLKYEKVEPGTLKKIGMIEIWPYWLTNLPYSGSLIPGPEKYTFRHTETKEELNEWILWSVPHDRQLAMWRPVPYPHAKLEESAADLKELLPQPHAKANKDAPIIITRQLTVELLSQLEAGAKVVLIPNGKTGSFPLKSQWFLKGGPFVSQTHSITGKAETTRQFLISLQHFDLAGEVVPDIEYLEEIDPILMLWDNHDIKEIKTHGLLFETKVGKGRLLVSSLNHQHNAGGLWLFRLLLFYLDSGPPPRNALKPETIARMRAKLNEKKLELVTKSWQFMPDGKNEGLKLGWEKPGFDDAAWKPIKIGQHWEGQGYPTLDGWAWYRLSVDIPKDWAGVPIYLNSEGVDDAYEIYVNGTKIGEGGDISNKKTAFEERKAHAIPASVLKPGEKNVIAVRVYDWYGAGGIHRPMTLSNVPIGGVDILK